MRFYDRQHRYYAGIDLHARTMHLCVLDQTAPSSATSTSPFEARSRQAGANGQAALTHKSCLVQPRG
jgi:hypothetical protein